MLLFLSHAGADTEAARRLKQRIESAPEAQARGLKVWFDKNDLRAGETWQSQLQDAIGKATAFAVYVGSRGVVNWVEAEVNLGLSRAISGSPRIPFISLPAREAAEEPFFGLKAVDETRSYLFFGRRTRDRGTGEEAEC